MPATATDKKMTVSWDDVNVVYSWPRPTQIKIDFYAQIALNDHLIHFSSPTMRVLDMSSPVDNFYWFPLEI